jgi:dTDP-4-amino-4,6-dideoxygalactose transaminase
LYVKPSLSSTEDEMNILFHDQQRSFGSHRVFVGDKIREVAATGEFILRKHVHELELAICRETGAANAVATASATGAMLLALKTMGVGPGTEVLLPAFGFPSPVNCLLNLNGSPVFVDVERQGGVLNAELLDSRVTRKTRVVLPMHLGRALADMEPIKSFAEAHDLHVLEDSAVALGSSIEGLAAGRWGQAGVFSFFPSKPLGGIGDAGMLVTDDADLAMRCRRLRNHGQEQGARFVYQEVGWNSRMDETAAAFLLMKLNTFRASLRRRAEIAAAYDRQFAGLDERLCPLLADRPDRAAHRYVVVAEAREALGRHLKNSGVATELFHPTPLHLQPGFQGLGYCAGDFPVAEWLSNRTLALPFYPELTDDEVDYVAGKVLEFYE